MVETDSDVSKKLGLDRTKGSKTFWAGLAGAAVLVIAGLIIWSGRADGDDATKYVTSQAAKNSFAVIVTATGSVEPTNLVEISSELSGTLASVEVDYNTRVEVGTVLATLDTTKLEALVDVQKASLDAAIARVAIAQATLDDAREKYDAALNLDRQGVTSHQAFITQKANYVRAQAEYQSSVANRTLAEANLDLQQSELEKACICSPIEGVVLDRAVDVGQIVAASLSAPVLFTVAEDLREMELQVDIDEADIGQVSVGDAALFTVDAYDEMQFPAEIAEIRFSPETIDGVVTYKAILTIDNSELLLRPGMTATADITVEEIEDALVIPNSALRYAPPLPPSTQAEDDRSGLLGMLMPERPDDTRQASNSKTVWILVDNKAREIPISTGSSNGTWTEVLGGELEVGSVVITDQIDG